MPNLTDPNLDEEAAVQRAIEGYNAAPAIGGTIGTAAGSIIGGLLGTAVPVVGNAVGAGLGGAAGGALGTLGGQAVATIGGNAETDKLKQLEAARLTPGILQEARMQAFNSLLGKYSNFK